MRTIRLEEVEGLSNGNTVTECGIKSRHIQGLCLLFPASHSRNFLRELALRNKQTKALFEMQCCFLKVTQHLQNCGWEQKMTLNSVNLETPVGGTRMGNPGENSRRAE